MCSQKLISEIEEIKPVYLTISNTDLTEGRGHSIVLSVSFLKETAIRIGRKKGVMGSDCHVEDSIAFKLNNHWFARREIKKPSQEDSEANDRDTKRLEAVNRAKELGLSDEDILLIGY